MTQPSDLWGPIPERTADEPVDLRVINATTINGKLAIDGESAGIGNDLDAALLSFARSWADCVLVGAGTIRAEDYGGVQLTDAEKATRRARGQAPVPPIVAVTASLHLDPASRFFRETEVAPIVLHGASDDSALRDTGAHLVRREDLTAAGILNYLAAQGFRRILLEGGPSLIEQFAAASLIDGYHLTVSPLVAAEPDRGDNADSDNAAAGTTITRFDLKAATDAGDGALFLRYHR